MGQGYLVLGFLFGLDEKSRFGDRSDTNVAYCRRELRFPTIVVTHNLKVDTALVIDQMIWGYEQSDAGWELL